MDIQENNTIKIYVGTIKIIHFLDQTRFHIEIIRSKMLTTNNCMLVYFKVHSTNGCNPFIIKLFIFLEI